mmetsp:Transcript_23872/g.38953  ORF Transcript_23872/g.38953 Transcript_23872/m.38953 type:complete len:200 (+) Transcript_23872:1272-1871(+)
MRLLFARCWRISAQATALLVETITSRRPWRRGVLNRWSTTIAWTTGAAWDLSPERQDPVLCKNSSSTFESSGNSSRRMASKRAATRSRAWSKTASLGSAAILSAQSCAPAAASSAARFRSPSTASDGDFAAAYRCNTEITAGRDASLVHLLTSISEKMAGHCSCSSRQVVSADLASPASCRRTTSKIRALHSCTTGHMR